MSWENVVAPVAAAAATAAVGYWGYKKGRHQDAAVERSGVATESRAGITQRFEIMDGIIDNLQEDNRIGRDEARLLRTELRLCGEHALRDVEAVTVERDEARREVARLRAQYEPGP